jgi:hypothetical protein
VTLGAGADEEVHGLHFGYKEGNLVFTPNVWGGAPNDGEHY